MENLRKEYLRRLGKQTAANINKVSDNTASPFSTRTTVASELLKILGWDLQLSNYPENIGSVFVNETTRFVKDAFAQTGYLPPNAWMFLKGEDIGVFDEYEDLSRLERILGTRQDISLALGDLLRPDIVIGRYPLVATEMSTAIEAVFADDNVANGFPPQLSKQPHPRPILHASISCKWTIRSDRSQNTRTEALNLIRNRKGHLPHIVAVTAEPLPTRIATLALGTGDLDCVYHFALHELSESLSAAENIDQIDMLEMLIQGRRLRDISDLPFDLAT